MKKFEKNQTVYTASSAGVRLWTVVFDYDGVDRTVLCDPFKRIEITYPTNAIFANREDAEAYHKEAAKRVDAMLAAADNIIMTAESVR